MATRALITCSEPHLDGTTRVQVQQDFDTPAEAAAWLQQQGVGFRGYTPFKVGITFYITEKQQAA